jgi:hypothetical protein
MFGDVHRLAAQCQVVEDRRVRDGKRQLKDGKRQHWLGQRAPDAPRPAGARAGGIEPFWQPVVDQRRNRQRQQQMLDHVRRKQVIVRQRLQRR